MNEEQKNIETCLAENILSEVANVPTDPQFRSLVEESIDPSRLQAAAQTGWEDYEKVVWTHKPYTFTSQVKQMKSNLILLLRRLWRYPFGRGTTASSAAGSSSAAAPIRSLADMWQHYIQRLKGNPEYGIPSRLSQLTDLPSAPALLADRKIGGAIGAPDGISLAQLLCSTSAASSVTEIVDTNVGWTMNSGYLANFLAMFVNLRLLKINCKGTIGNKAIANISHIEEIDAPYITANSSFSAGNDTPTMPACISNLASCKKINMPGFVDCTFYGNGNQYSAVIAGCPVLEDVVLGRVANNNYPGIGYTKWVIQYCQNIKALHVPSFVKNNYMIRSGQNANLILIDIQGTQEESFSLYWWSPTLDSSNLQQFLSNFKTYIAERLTDKGTGLTLTLSQKVRNAIHAAESTYGIENIIITQKGWTISPAPN